MTEVGLEHSASRRKGRRFEDISGSTLTERFKELRTKILLQPNNFARVVSIFTLQIMGKHIVEIAVLLGLLAVGAIWFYRLLGDIARLKDTVQLVTGALVVIGILYIVLTYHYNYRAKKRNRFMERIY